MRQDEILEVLRTAITELYESDQILLKEDYDIHERTVAHRLAMYIEKHIPADYNVDIEYNRMRTAYGNDHDVGQLMSKKLNYNPTEEGSSYVYPDVIVHKRDKDDNLLIIEIKMAWKSEKKYLDHQKIDAYMEELNYKYGVYLELAESIEDYKLQFGPFSNVNKDKAERPTTYDAGA